MTKTATPGQIQTIQKLLGNFTAEQIQAALDDGSLRRALTKSVGRIDLTRLDHHNLYPIAGTLSAMIAPEGCKPSPADILRVRKLDPVHPLGTLQKIADEYGWRLLDVLPEVTWITCRKT